MSNWSLLTVRVGDVDLAAVRLDDGKIVVPDILRPYPGLRSVLDDWDVLEPALRALDPVGLPELTGSTATATVRYPNKLLGMGPNYYDHMAEMGSPPAPADAQPFFYCVPPTTTMIGSGQPILISDDAAMLPDWEAELAVIIGRGGRDINESNALEHAAGYACFNDITARGLMRRVPALAEPFTWDWTACKGPDTFCPMGAMTPAWMVPDPQALTIRCTVNGVVKQDSTTAVMIASVAKVIAAASRFWTLEPEMSSPPERLPVWATDDRNTWLTATRCAWRSAIWCRWSTWSGPEPPLPRWWLPDPRTRRDRRPAAQRPAGVDRRMFYRTRAHRPVDGRAPVNSSQRNGLSRRQTLLVLVSSMTT